MVRCRVNRALLALAVLLTLGACSSGPSLEIPVGTYAPVPNVAEGGLPVPELNDTLSPGRPYHIGPLDRLRIELFGLDQTQTGREIQVDAAGQISVPLAGSIDALGRTPRDLEQEIAARLRTAYVRNPQVSVNLVEMVSQTFTVDGSVGQPGRYPVVGRVTLVRAIATARGTSEFARDGNVLVFRRVGGQQMVGLYNLRAVRQGLYADPDIYPNDVIVVDESRARRMFRDALQVAPLLLSPLIAILQSN